MMNLYNVASTKANKVREIPKGFLRMHRTYVTYMILSCVYINLSPVEVKYARNLKQVLRR